MSFSSTYLTNFSLIFVFFHLITIWVGVVCSSFYPALGTLMFLDLWFFAFIKFGNFLPFFFSNIFPFTPLFPKLYGRLLDIIPWVADAPFIYFRASFSLFSVDGFFCPICKFTGHSSSASNLLLAYAVNFLISILFILNLEILFYFYFIFIYPFL